MSARTRAQRMQRIRSSRPRGGLTRRRFNQSLLASAVAAHLRPAWGRSPRGYPLGPVTPPVTTNYLGANINILSGYSTEQPFLNIMKSGSSNNSNFTAWNPQGTMTYPQLASVLDSNGYPQSLPGSNAVNVYMNSSFNDQDGSGYGNGLPPGAIALYPSGSYTLSFQGACTLGLSGNVTSGSLATSSPNVTVGALSITSTMTSGQTGVVTFTVPAATTAGSGAIILTISALPSNTNYFRNASLVRTAQVASYNAGALFDPNWIASITNNGAGGYRRLRAMGAMLMTGQFYAFAVPALTSGSGLTQTMTTVWNGPSGTYPCTLGSGVAGDVAQNNTVTVTYGSTTAVFGSAFTQNVTASGDNLWVPIFSSWGQRNQPGYAFWAAANGNGTPAMLPYEVFIEMCNACNCDCWLNIPLWANSFTGNQAFWTSLATLVKNTLNPGLKCFVEFGNEIFFESNEGYYYAQSISMAQIGSTVFTEFMGLNYALISQAFTAVLGTGSLGTTFFIGPSTEVSSSSGGNGIAFLKTMMNTPLSVSHGLLTQPAYNYLTHWSMAPYFPGSDLNATDYTTMMGVTAPLDDFFACMYGNTGTAANGSHVYSSGYAAGWVGSTLANIGISISNITSQPWGNYPIHCYESGQSFPCNGFSNTAGSYTGPWGGGAYTTLQNAITALVEAAHRDVRMQYVLYDPTNQFSSNPGFLPAAVTAGVTSMNYFDSCQAMSQYGPWGALENIMQLPSWGARGWLRLTRAIRASWAGLISRLASWQRVIGCQPSSR